MAKNRISDGKVLTLIVAAGIKSGDPVVVGQIAGVALIDADAVTNKATVDTKGVFDLAVKAIDGAGNSAVVVGDVLYYVAADTPKLSKKNTGVLYGYALEAVAAGATGTINVRLKG